LTISSRPGYRLAIGDHAFIMFDGDHMCRTEREQGARQSAWARADLDHGCVFQRAGGARDACGEVEVEQEILP
jgi:hypothetical protein